MTALSRNPATTNNLLPNRFRFILDRAPNLEMWCQTVALPGFSIDPTKMPTPFVDLPISGDHISYETLGITMLVDEELSNYMELYTWMRGLGFPDSYDEYAALSSQPKILDAGVKSEVSVFLLDGQQRPKFRWTFHDAFPISLGGWDLTSTDPGLGRVVCHAAFKYSTFDVTLVT